MEKLGISLVLENIVAGVFHFVDVDRIGHFRMFDNPVWP